MTPFPWGHVNPAWLLSTLPLEDGAGRSVTYPWSPGQWQGQESLETQAGAGSRLWIQECYSLGEGSMRLGVLVEAW